MAISVLEISLFHTEMDDTKYVLRPSDRDVNWRPPVQGKTPHVQVKEP